MGPVDVAGEGVQDLNGVFGGGDVKQTQDNIALGQKYQAKFS